MRNCVICGLLFFAFVGCGESDPSVERSLDVSPVAPHQAQLTKEFREFNDDLAALSHRAKQLDAKYEFRSAAKVWGQVQQLVASKFGPDSWQSRNAEFAYRHSIRNSELSQTQLAEFKQLEQLQQSVTASFRAGNFENAIDLCRQLLTRQASLFGADSISVGQTKIQLASFQGNLNRIEPAIKNFHSAINILKSNGYENHPELELSHAGLAALYIKKDSMLPAIANQKEAARLAGEIWGKQSLKFATQANQLGAMFHQAGNLEVAFEILSTTKSIREKQLGPEHSAFGHSCLNLGVVMMDLKRLDIAEQNISNALNIFVREEGPSGTMTLKCKSQLATVFMLNKQPQMAEPLLQDVVTVLGSSQNPPIDELLSHQYKLAVALARQGKYKSSRPMLEHLIENQSSRYGSNDGRTISSMRALALLLERTHQTAQAKAMKQQIERIAQATNSNDFSTLR